MSHNIESAEKKTASHADQKLFLLSTLLQLEKRVRHSVTFKELEFIFVNETLRLVNYRQAIFWRPGPSIGVRIDSVSGVERPDPNAPFILFIKGFTQNFFKKRESREIHIVVEDELDEEFRSGWREWGMGTALWCPLISPRGDIIGGLLFCREAAWEKGDLALIERLSDAYAHAWWALGRSRGPWRNRMMPASLKRILKLAGFFFIVYMLFQPVRLSVLAPFEIVPNDPLIVSAPMDGVIKVFHVQPSQVVKKNALLFSLDDTSIRSAYEVSKKALSVVRAEYTRTRQRSFFDEKSRSDILLLKAQIDQKSSEVSYAAEVLQRTKVLADREGVAVFGDVNDWLGKPVVVGEKVLKIADPMRAEVEIQLPVEDAINLELGADVLAFLNTAPDRPLKAKLVKASYEAVETPGGILAFRLKATPTGKEKSPRIGLRGTAKIYGKEVSLFYYLLRRPFTTLRQKLGV